MTDPSPAIQATTAAVPDEEVREAFSGPAVTINRMIATNSPDGMRIAFLEQHVRTAAIFRTAVFMSFGDALALQGLIATQLQKAGVLPAPVESTKPDAT